MPKDIYYYHWSRYPQTRDGAWIAPSELERQATPDPERPKPKRQSRQKGDKTEEGKQSQARGGKKNQARRSKNKNNKK